MLRGQLMMLMVSCISRSSPCILDVSFVSLTEHNLAILQYRSNLPKYCDRCFNMHLITLLSVTLFAVSGAHGATIDDRDYCKLISVGGIMCCPGPSHLYAFQTPQDTLGAVQNYSSALRDSGMSRFCQPQDL